MNADAINLQDFKIIQKIGEGACANVYLIENLITNKKYVAKISNTQIEQIEEKGIFFTELQTYSKIDNPAILKFYGYCFNNFSNEPFPTLILEYMPNKSLDIFLNNVRNSYFPENFVNTKKYIIILGIAIGMKYLHSQGIIHRDLKPMNILLDENFNPQISDFGISFISDQKLSEIEMDDFVGTPLYMSPESYSDFYTYKVDIYAFSLIMFEIISEEKPFREYSIKSKRQLYGAISKGIRPNLSSISDQNIRNLIERCWDTDPSKRPDFSDILDELLSEKFRFYFRADEKAVSNYLSIYNNDLFNKNLYKSLDIKRAISENNIDAILFYAFKLYYHDHVESNLKKAVKYFKIAADKGNEIGMFMYALMLQTGRGIEMNTKEAIKYFKKLADKGELFSMAIYGELQIKKKWNIHK